MTRAESESSEAHDVGPVAPEGWWFVGDQRLGSKKTTTKTNRGGKQRLTPKKGRAKTLLVGCLFGKYSTFSQPDGFLVDENNLSS